MRSFFLLLIVCFGFGSCRGSEIKAILLCDTKAENIEKSVASDMKNVQEVFKKISKKTGIKLSTTVISNDYLKDPFVTHISSLQIQEDDIVFFYFSGHGFRTELKKNNQWPNLFLTADGQAIDFKEICQFLLEKKPRLFIAFADCCNNVLSEMNAPLTEPILAYKSHKPLTNDINNYKRLFLKTKGSILISGAAPGEFSWGTVKGGLFTLAFLQSMMDEASYPRPASWRTLIERAAIKIMKKDIGQNPQFEMNLLEGV